jgi:hypothetical protein
MLSVFRKERAVACRRGGSKARVTADPGLTSSARPVMPEGISKVLDGPTNRVVKKLAILRHLAMDRRSRGLREISVSGCVPADCHERMRRQQVQLLQRETFLICQRGAVDVVVRYRFADVRQYVEVTMDGGFNCRERASFGSKVSTLVA